MTTGEAIGVTPPETSRASTAVTGLWSNLSDRLNPILVREVQQAVKGRVFTLTILVALAISVVIAVVVAAEYADTGTGRQAFKAGFATLVPLVLFVVPMQAYQSMRTELRGGIVEQLLLSRLSPGAVLFGKLQAAMVQFVLYVSVMSPLLATSYLLRGVDLVTIAISLAFALIVCVAGTAFAVSSAAQAIVPALQGLANLGIAFGLGMATFALCGFIISGQYTLMVGALLRSSEFWAVFSGITLAATVITVLSWLAARSFLLHAFENKSTGFRLFLFAAPLVLFGWMLLFLDPGTWSEAFPVMAFALLMTGVVFAVFMITEQQRLSPRVRAHVPSNHLMAVLATPFLPGRDRGMMCFMLYAGLLAGVAWIFWPSGSGSVSWWHPLVVVPRLGAMAIAYALVYLGIGRWLRGRLPDTLQGNHAGRFALPVILFLCCVMPLLVDVFARGEVDSWHYGHVMNPFWTIEEHIDPDRWQSFRGVVLIAIAVAAVLMLPSWLRGVREVTAATAARRARSMAAPSVTAPTVGVDG